MLTPVSKPESPRASRGNTSSDTADHGQRVAVVGEQMCFCQSARDLRLGEDLVEADGHHHQVKKQIGPDDGNRDADGLSKAFQKDGAKQPQAAAA